LLFWNWFVKGLFYLTIGQIIKWLCLSKAQSLDLGLDPDPPEILDRDPDTVLVTVGPTTLVFRQWMEQINYVCIYIFLKESEYLQYVVSCDFFLPCIFCMASGDLSKERNYPRPERCPGSDDQHPRGPAHRHRCLQSQVACRRQCCGSGMFIPDPGSWFLSISDPGS
jgi:hypothetical protein